MGRYPKQIWYLANEQKPNTSRQVRHWRRKTILAALKAWRWNWQSMAGLVKVYMCEGSTVLWEIPIPKELLGEYADKT